MSQHIVNRRNDFLRDLYRHIEPERFRNEYVPNNELILSLEEMSKGIYDDVNTVISENISKLYLGLQGDELFKKVSADNNLFNWERTTILLNGGKRK